MARKRKAPEEPKGGLPEWVTTYSDMVTLLLTFFVMLTTMSRVRSRELKEMFAYFPGAVAEMGYAQYTDTTVLAPIVDVLMQSVAEEMERGGAGPELEEEDFVPLDEWLKEQTEVQIIKRRDRREIRMESAGMYEPGSDRITPTGEALLRRIAQILQSAPYRLRVVNRYPEEFRDERFADGWEMAMARSARAVEHLAAREKVDQRRLAVSGLGSRARRIGWKPKEDVAFVFLPPEPPPEVVPRQPQDRPPDRPPDGQPDGQPALRPGQPRGG